VSEHTAAEERARTATESPGGTTKGAGPASTSPGAATESPRAAAESADNGAISALLVDWGGVMTTNLFRSFSDFCEAEGLEPAALFQVFRDDKTARELLIGFEEGRIAEADFEDQLGCLLGLTSPAGLIDRLFSGATLEEAMVNAVRAARGAGITTGLISNSWGTTRYPRELLGELFDGVVISGEVGIRKPAPRIYELGVQAIGHEPTRCVFVDDLPFNLTPAEEMGMATVHHTTAESTIAELERLLGVSLRDGAALRDPAGRVFG
jgi:putative hydrolase of the HAD superfamily